MLFETSRGTFDKLLNYLNTAVCRVILYKSFSYVSIKNSRNTHRIYT